MIGYVAVMSQYPNLGMEESGLAHLKGLWHLIYYTIL